MRHGKKISNADLIGEQGLHYVAQVVNEMGHIFRVEREQDAGIDGHIEIRDPKTQEMSNARILVQVKATSSRWTGEDENRFSYTVARRDLDYWFKSRIPVILVVSRPSTDEAYWVSIQDWFAKVDVRQGRKIEFRKDVHRFDAGAAMRLADLAVPLSTGKHASPRVQKESLTANLLPVRVLAPKVFVAPSPYRSRRDVWNVVGRDDPSVGGEWLLREGMILSFYDLREEPWRSVCEWQATDDFSSDEWSGSSETNRQDAMVQLLEHALENRLWSDHVLLAPRSRPSLFYFDAAGGLDAQGERKQPSGRGERVRTVVSTHGKGGRGFVRHYGFEAVFHHLNAAWFLQVNPTYVFTTNGRSRHPKERELLSGVKRLERNGAVSLLVSFWGHYLTSVTSNPPLLEPKSPFIQLDPPLTFEVAEGLVESDWTMAAHGIRPSDGPVDGPLFDVDE